MTRSCEALIEAALRLFAEVPGHRVADALGGHITQSDVSRWRRGVRMALKTPKRKFLEQAVDVWERSGSPPGEQGLEAVSRRMGLHKSERAKTLMRFISHPDILPREMDWPTRFGIAERWMKVDRFNQAERRQFMAWWREINEAKDAITPKSARGR